MFKKILKSTLLVFAAIIALSYAFGYDYIFRAVRQTYLRGESGSTIDDGKNFSSNVIGKGQSIPWDNDTLYNRKALSKILVKDLERSKTSAFVVIKKGKLIHEEYWDSYKRDSKTNSFSMAKGVTVLLLGKMLEEKKITSLDQKYSDFYGNYENVPFGNHLTLGELAKMEAGLNWTENYKNPFLQAAKAYYGKSLEEAAFLRGFKEEPGTRFEYQSGATQLLGFALRKSMNKTLSQYASEKFWQPLGMEHNATWSTDDFEMEKTFCCIHSNARDFAKLGQLFLNGGKVGDNQIINSKFLEEMHAGTKLSREAYGMGLWVNNDAKIKHYYFFGLYGQYIIIIPEKEMIIVRTGMYKNQPKDEKGRPKQVAFLVDQVAENFN